MFDYLSRRQKLLENIRTLDVDAILITDEINVRYLSGFTGDSTYLLLSPTHQFIISDSRYDTQIADECPDLELVTRTARVEMQQSISDTVAKAGYSKIAYESDALTKHRFDQFLQAMPSVQWCDTQQLVVNQRAVKDEQEIQIIRHSIDLAQRAFLAAKATLSGGQTERQVAHRMEATIRDLGGQGRAFDMIVGVGPRAALPHAGITDCRIDASSFVLLDWGANYAGYASDLTRVLVTGSVSQEFTKVYETVRQAQLKAIQTIRPGAKLVDVDSAARDFIADAGYGDYFGHGLGHGFGLQIHEQPRFSPTAQGVLEPGMVITVEPGIYLPGNLGVRIEDDVLVTEDGCEVLSSLPTALEDNIVSLL